MQSPPPVKRRGKKLRVIAESSLRRQVMLEARRLERRARQLRRLAKLLS